eukprot:6210038-Pleurochrysis_carterae.AAC.1
MEEALADSFLLYASESQSDRYVESLSSDSVPDSCEMPPNIPAPNASETARPDYAPPAAANATEFDDDLAASFLVDSASSNETGNDSGECADDWNECVEVNEEKTVEKLPAVRAGGAAATTSNAGIDITHTKRGRYDRTTARRKGNHHDQAGDHLALIQNSSLGTPCGPHCLNNGRCGNAITKNELYVCHEQSYGITTKHPKTGGWHTSYSCGKTHELWQFTYNTASRVTCADFARVAYGIPKIAWDESIALLRKSPNSLKVATEGRRWRKSMKAALAQEKTSSISNAIVWWLQILPLWDAIPNECIIKHPRLVWDRLY